MEIAPVASTSSPTSPAGSGRSRHAFAEVIALEGVMGDSALLTVRLPPSTVGDVSPGRFFEILCRSPEAQDPLLRRPYSAFAADPEQGEVTFLVRPFGRGSEWLTNRRPGDRLDLLGPLGNAFAIEPRARNLLMVAGGVGVAPLVMLAYQAVASGRSVTFLMGAAAAAGLLPASYLPTAVEYVGATDDGSKGHHGFVTDLVADYVRWAAQIFACGPEPMYRSLRAAVLPHRIGKRPPVQISVEREMACGFGACLGCVVETRRGMRPSCTEGPVFDLDDVVW